MTIRATILAALAAAAVLTVSACGSAGAAGSTALGGAASIAPANAAAFVAVDTNLSSGQWSAVDDLLGKFPSKDTLLTQLRTSFEQKTKLNWEQDVKPALGDELDVVVLPGAKHEYVALTQSHDQAKLDALVKKLGDVSGQVGGWTAIADSQEQIDAVANATSALADAQAYRAATAKLDDDALVHAYANAQEATKGLSTAKDPSQELPLEWASADVTAAGDGLRMHVYSHDQTVVSSVPLNRRPHAVDAYQSHLVDEIPAGALAVADFMVTPGFFEIADTAGLPKQLQDVPLLASSLDTILGGETAIYVRPGLLIPEITIATQPSDIDEAQDELDGLVKTLKKQATGVLAQLQIYHDVVGGQLVISTSLKGIADFRSGGDKLSGDSTFTDAQKRSGMPEQTTGFVYVNVKDGLPLLQAFLPLLGVKLPPIAQGDELGAIRTLTAYGARTGQDQSYTVYLQVQ